jgi:hypothetical protein
MSNEIRLSAPQAASGSSRTDSSRAKAPASRELKAWEDPVMLDEGKAFGAGCSAGDNYYVKCDSGGQGDL